MRELLKAAETVVDEYQGFASPHFHSLLVKLEEAIAAAKERSKWVKVADGLPVVPEGSDYVCIWCWKEGALRTPWVSRWYGGFSANAEYFTHWQYHIANTPAPPEDL